MTDSAGLSLDDSRRLSNLVALAALVRLPILLTMLSNPDLARQTDDYLRYGSEWLATGRYSEEWFPPLYPLLCGKAAQIAGNSAVAVILIFQLFAGLFSVILMHRIARSLGLAPWPALAAAGVMALDPGLIQYSALVSTESLFVVLVLWSLSLVISPSRMRSIHTAGLLFGLALLTRSVGLMLLPFFLGILLWRKAFGQALLFAVMATMTVSPWVFRNGVTYGRYALSPSGAYNFAALIAAPAKAAVDGTDRVTALSSWEAAVPTVARTNPFMRGEALAKMARTWIAEHPIPFLLAFFRGLFNLFFGSDLSGIGPHLFGTAWAALRSPLLLLILLWRALTLGTAALAIPLALLRGARGISVVGCWAAVILLALPVGAGGYSRFLAPIIPFIALATGLFFELKALPRKENHDSR